MMHTRAATLPRLLRGPGLLGVLGTLAATVLLAGCATAAPSGAAVTTPLPAPTAPMCGPDSHPTPAPSASASASATRYIPCDYDLRHARVFLDTALPLLPTTRVDVASVDRIAGADSYLAGFAAKYQGAALESDGTLVASWIPTPSTCAVFHWDGTRWDSGIVGELVSGGCG